MRFKNNKTKAANEKESDWIRKNEGVNRSNIRIQKIKD